MRLYTFDCVVECQHLRGFVSRIDGPLTSAGVEVRGISAPIDPDKWVFDRVMVGRVSEGGIARKVIEQVRRRGYSITGMRGPVTKFTVTDIVMDGGTVRLYSTMDDIAEFRAGLRRLQLTKGGASFNIKSETALGEVEIRSQQEAEQLGILSHLRLLKLGFYAVTTQVANPVSRIENIMLRRLNEKMKGLGVDVVGIKFEKVVRTDTGEDILEDLKDPRQRYHSIFLSHTSADKVFARKLRADLLAKGASEVWFDEAEIKIGDSLIEKIQQGLKRARYFAIVLSPKALDSPWVKKELEYALHREITSGEVSILPIVYQQCDLPPFLTGKLYADFSEPLLYEKGIAQLLDRLARPSWRVGA